MPDSGDNYEIEFDEFEATFIPGQDDDADIDLNANVSLVVDKVETIPMEDGGLVIVGRGGEATIVFDDALVSRHHCLFKRRGSHVELRDLGSGNGTFVNGEKVFECEVFSGDVVRIGPFEIEVSVTYAGDDSQASRTRSGSIPSFSELLLGGARNPIAEAFTPPGERDIPATPAPSSREPVPDVVARFDDERFDEDGFSDNAELDDEFPSAPPVPPSRANPPAPRASSERRAAPPTERPSSERRAAAPGRPSSERRAAAPPERKTGRPPERPSSERRAASPAGSGPPSGGARRPSERRQAAPGGPPTSKQRRPSERRPAPGGPIPGGPKPGGPKPGPGPRASGRRRGPPGKPGSRPSAGDIVAPGDMPRTQRHPAGPGPRATGRMRAGDLKLGSRPGREESSDSVPQRDAPLPPKLRLSCEMSNSIVLAPGETRLIGRHPRCDMRFPIDDRLVSRKHARLHWAPERGPRIYDLGSRNGMSVDGAKTSEAPLFVGSTIRFGPYRIRVIAAGPDEKGD